MFFYRNLFLSRDKTLYDPWTLTQKNAYWKGTTELEAAAKKVHPKPELLIKALMMRYIFRVNGETADFFRERVQSVSSKLRRPYAAIHVRRTDKVARGGEAKKHEVWEYMEMVEYFFDHIASDGNDNWKDKKRSLYVATDEKAVLKELEESYGDRYDIVNFEEGTATAQKRRGNPVGVYGIGTKYVLLDIALLANSDFMVGTFSSQISRLAYELRTSLEPSNGYLRAVKPHLVDLKKRAFKGRNRYFQTRPVINNTYPIVAASIDDWWYYGT